MKATIKTKLPFELEELPLPHDGDASRGVRRLRLGVSGLLVKLSSLALALSGAGALSPEVSAQTLGTPTYLTSWDDAVTGGNTFSSGGKQRWYVDPGADNYFTDDYERPMNQSFSYNDGIYSTNSDYFGNLDIVQGRAGFDANFLYFGIEMFSTKLYGADGSVKDEGLKYDYRIRLGADPTGAGGYLFSTDTPSDFGSSWHTEKNFAWLDSNMDVNTDGNGFETRIVSDGKLDKTGASVFFTRIDPTNSSTVEFAIRYSAFGWSEADIQQFPYLVFEANKGLKDNGNYHWNKEYTASEAGSPNGGAGGLSEFGTQGLGNIYELDTLRGGVIPEPSSALLVMAAAGGTLLIRRRR
jgi:hypothetical protein